ncbi:MAG TPA: transglutaminase-like cysteine peptidase [Xanthobacteraceae bacterium]|nr:transglutaminase-like cysteine peptidase [Xanthobacteraceae bacterium]
MTRVLTAGVLVAIPCASSIALEEQPLYTIPVEPAPPPEAWHDFCRRNSHECEPGESTRRNVILTPETWDELGSINRRANASIKPKTDEDHWRQSDKWDYPDDGFGDCEDYTLLKRRLLIEAGWPRAALLITVVWTPQNQGHAVLLVRTDQGEFVLDSENPNILHWTKTPYRYVKRQRATHPNEWVYIDGDSPPAEQIPSMPIPSTLPSAS